MRRDIYRLCQGSASVSSELAKDPTTSPAMICKKLYASDRCRARANIDVKTHDNGHDLDEVLKCGRWGPSRPSDLFLKIYADVLDTLQDDPLVGVCSPNLLGSNGVCPLTLFATIPEVCRHMSNLIARAEEEVFLATNYWMISEGSKLISNALRELSRRSVAEGRRVVVKVLYDRGNAKSIVENHVPVTPKTYADPDGTIGLPYPDELPNIDLEVVDYHRPILGTFHAKFMVVDRKIAILQSNNIMDNDNLEMMAQYEGDIVDSIYDMALIMWHNEVRPELPRIGQPAVDVPTPTSTTSSFRSLFESSGEASPMRSRQASSQASNTNSPQHTSREPHYDADIAGELARMTESLACRDDERAVDSVSRFLNGPTADNQSANGPDVEPQDMIMPMIPIQPHDPFPIAMVNRPPHGTPNARSLRTPQNAAFMSAFRNAEDNIFIQTPDLNAQDLLPEILAACRRGIKVRYCYCLGYNDAGELLPQQGGNNEMVANKLYHELDPQFHQNLEVYAYVAKDQTKPIHNKFKKRSCHIKLMIVDGHIGIQGSGNQDTQSWYHSQEANVMIDSGLVCSKWIEGLKRNQNTHIYGRVSSEGAKAGIWIDSETGKIPDGTLGADPGHFAWAKGAVGAIKRLRGKGGF